MIMLKTFTLFLLAALLMVQFGCSQKPAQAAPAHSQAEPDWVKECSGLPDEWYCGYGASKEEAMDRMVNQIRVKIESEHSIEVEQTMRAGEDIKKSETLSQKYKQKVKISTGSIEMTDIKFYTSQNDATYAAVKKADVAKAFAEQLRPMAASLEFSVNAVIDAKHPKLKNEAWQKTQAIWNEFAPLLIQTESLDKEKAVSFKPASDLYAKAREEYLGYCKTAKLYWVPEQDDIFSNVAFSKLSKNLKLEKATCDGHGISLVYKNTGRECKHAGMFRCSHKPSLLIASCYGEEYRRLESSNVETFQKVEEVALKKLPEKLENEDFWSEWEHEIKQWRPICE
jgi:hypothetical protein